jgi:hypothetical protein
MINSMETQSNPCFLLFCEPRDAYKGLFARNRELAKMGMDAMRFRPEKDRNQQRSPLEFGAIHCFFRFED